MNKSWSNVVSIFRNTTYAEESEKKDLLLTRLFALNLNAAIFEVILLMMDQLMVHQIKSCTTDTDIG